LMPFSTYTHIFPYRYLIGIRLLTYLWHIILMLHNQHFIQPYLVGKGKKSLAMILPSEVVKSLKIDPLSIILLLKVNGIDDIQLRIIREEDLVKKDTENMILLKSFRLANRYHLLTQVKISYAK
jgi:hypothetical protein